MINILVCVLNFHQHDFVIDLIKDFNNQEGEFKYYIYIGDILPHSNEQEKLKSQLTLLKYENIECSYVAFSKNLGYARGNNEIIKLALKKYEFDYILVSNPDIHIKDDNVILKMVEDIETKNIVLVGPKVRLLNGRQQGPYLKQNPWICGLKHLLPFVRLPFWYIHKKRNSSLSHKKKVWRVIGAFMLVKKGAFLQINMFDENTFLYWEEDIISFKFKKLNLNIIFDPTIEVIHKNNLTKKTNNFTNKTNIESMQIYFKIENKSQISIKFCKYCMEFYYKFWNKIKW